MINSILTRLNVGSKLWGVLVSAPVRHASKKTSGGKRNPKHSKGQARGLKAHEGHVVNKSDIIATQIRLNWLPGLNVEMKGNLTLCAMKKGKVIITCETPDLNMDHFINQKWYIGRQGLTFFKKYVHVIPEPQHTRFKLIAQV